MQIRHIICLLSLVAVGLGFTSQAHAAGGNYVFVGGTNPQRAEVKKALNASSFNWSLVPQQVTIRIAPGVPSQATPGQIWLDADLLDAGDFSWGVVQHEYAHQVDFFLLDDAKRTLVGGLFGTSDWCYGVAGLSHGAYGCERFASTLAWAYWPSAKNSMRPVSKTDEAAAMAPAAFRALLGKLIGAPTQPPAAHAVALTPPTRTTAANKATPKKTAPRKTSAKKN